MARATETLNQACALLRIVREMVEEVRGISEEKATLERLNVSLGNKAVQIQRATSGLQS